MENKELETIKRTRKEIDSLMTIRNIIKKEYDSKILDRENIQTKIDILNSKLNDVIIRLDNQKESKLRYVYVLNCISLCAIFSSLAIYGCYVADIINYLLLTSAPVLGVCFGYVYAEVYIRENANKLELKLKKKHPEIKKLVNERDNLLNAVRVNQNNLEQINISSKETLSNLLSNQDNINEQLISLYKLENGNYETTTEEYTEESKEPSIQNRGYSRIKRKNRK